MHSTGNKKKLTLNNIPSTSNNSYFPRSRKKSKLRKVVSAIDESSCSEDAEIVKRRRKPTLRALSDYESGENDVEKVGSSSVSGVNKRQLTSTENVCFSSIKYKNSSSSDSGELFTMYSRPLSVKRLTDYESEESSIDQPRKSLLNLSRVDQHLNNPTNSLKQNDDLQMSCESDSAYKIVKNNNKSKRPNGLLSTSDSSDSDTPLRQQCFRKRKRIINSSSDDTNINVAQSHRRGRQSQNDLPRTNGGIEYTDTRPQVRRRLRPRINNRRTYNETDSDSSDVEIFRSVVKRRTDKCNSYINNFNNSQENLMGSSSSDDHFNTIINELIQQTNRPSVTRRPITRQLSCRNNELEAKRFLSMERDSEMENQWLISNEEGIAFNSLRRRNVSESQSQPPQQSYFDSSDTDTSSLFELRRVRGGAVQIHSSDSESDSNSETRPTVINSGMGNLDGSFHPLIPSIIQDENLSDSDADSEKCPICFSCFGPKEVASPASCDHSFCTSCIQEWAKSNNTCPIDRKLFNKIIVRPSFNGGVIREIPVETPPIETRFWVSDFIEEDEIDPIFLGAIVDVDLSSSEEEEEICCVCYSSDNSQNLILCDFCNNIYHMSCLTPPLRYVPASDWFCPPCSELEMVSDLY